MPTWWQQIVRPFRWIRSINQLYSLGGTRTEGLRTWDRRDARCTKLIVFVHGFNSSKDAAWDQFPALLMDDPDLAEFNFHRFGYPTAIVGQVNDIEDQGELLASFLKETLPTYNLTALVGHSMGGLVVLHAVLSLERQDFSLTANANLKVITFGTPYQGVENTAVLQLLFHNKQTRDMAMLSKTLSRLTWEWKLRFNQKSGERETPQIPIHAYYGIEDGFVLQGSACAGPVASCEPVDGDHITMVRPVDREHLAYTKLKGRVVEKAAVKARPTAEGKIGIWVSQIDGDEAAQAQGSLVHSLEFYIEQEPELKQLVEVRELPAKIVGDTLSDRKAEAVRLGQQHNAAIVVWGHVTSLLDTAEFHSRVTLVKASYFAPRTSVLRAITENQRHEAQLTAPPGTVSLPSEPLKEPLQLAGLVAAFSFFKEGEAAKAASLFEALLTAGGTSTVSFIVVSLYTSLAHMAVYKETKDREALIKSRDRMPDPVAVAEEYDSKGLLILVYTHRIVVICSLFDENLFTSADLQDSVALLFREFVPLFREEGKPKGWLEKVGFTLFLHRLSEACFKMAELDIESLENLERTLKAGEEASQGFKEEENWENYAASQEVLGETYMALATRGVDVDQNLANYVAALREIQRVSNKLRDWQRGVWSYFKFGVFNQKLAEICKEHGPQYHLDEACSAFEEALTIACQNEDKVAEAALLPFVDAARLAAGKAKPPTERESSAM